MIHINSYSSEYLEKSDLSSSDICNKAYGAITCIKTPKTFYLHISAKIADQFFSNCNLREKNKPWIC